MCMVWSLDPMSGGVLCLPLSSMQRSANSALCPNPYIFTNTSGDLHASWCFSDGSDGPWCLVWVE